MPVLPGGENGRKAYYNVVVAACRCGNSRDKNTPQLAIVFAHETEAEYGITAYRYLTPKTLEYVCKDLKVLGWDAVEHAYRFEELDGEDKSPLVGAKATICVQDEEYQGKFRPRVLFINPYGQEHGGGGGEPRERMAPAAAKSWGDEVRKALGVGPPAGPAAARPPAATRAKPPPSDPSDRQKRVEQATKDGIANQGGRSRPAPATAPPAQPTEGDDFDFEDIPFAWALWLLPVLGFLS